MKFKWQSAGFNLLTKYRCIFTGVFFTK